MFFPEAQWEYTCRAGFTAYSWGGDINGTLVIMQWCARPVMSDIMLQPWGFYDMHGNVVEWISGYYDIYERREVDPLILIRWISFEEGLTIWAMKPWLSCAWFYVLIIGIASIGFVLLIANHRCVQTISMFPTRRCKVRSHVTSDVTVDLAVEEEVNPDYPGTGAQPQYRCITIPLLQFTMNFTKKLDPMMIGWTSADKPGAVILRSTLSFVSRGIIWRPWM